LKKKKPLVFVILKDRVQVDTNMDTNWKLISKKDKKLKQKALSVEEKSNKNNATSTTTTATSETNDIYIKNIKDRITNTNDKLMIILRGPPGCGKSYLAS
jgi:DNA replication protein DnaC